MHVSLVLGQEENSFGHFLRTNGELDKTCAGKMMNAVGKAMIYSAQQRASLRSPLARLYQVMLFQLLTVLPLNTLGKSL